MKKAFTANIFLLWSMYGVILDMAFIFLSFFFTDVVYVWLKCQFTVKNTPKSFSQELFLICLFSIMMLVFTLELQIKWHLSGLAFIWLSLNHLKSVFKAFCIFNITVLWNRSTRYNFLLATFEFIKRIPPNPKIFTHTPKHSYDPLHNKK